MIVENGYIFCQSFSDMKLFANFNILMLLDFESFTNENITNIIKCSLENLIDLNNSFLEIDENIKENADHIEK
jgi:hypothetical protein